jgi:hypothetical protein
VLHAPFRRVANSMRTIGNCMAYGMGAACDRMAGIMQSLPNPRLRCGRGLVGTRRQRDHLATGKRQQKPRSAE